MDWLSNYQLFLFDFDGLLVDTEQLHYKAYINMCANRGYELKWDFKRYSQAAHHKPTDLRDHIYAEFPQLYTQEPDWKILYEEKKNAFLNLVKNEKVPLLPGAVELLMALKEQKIKRCIVTHSAYSLIDQIRSQNSVLDTIPHWITREDYVNPKPHPDSYQTAISKFAESGEQIIGFEDSPRGLEALMQTKATPVLVCPPDSPYLNSILKSQPNLHYYPSLSVCCSTMVNVQSVP